VNGLFLWILWCEFDDWYIPRLILMHMVMIICWELLSFFFYSSMCFMSGLVYTCWMIVTYEEVQINCHVWIIFWHIWLDSWAANFCEYILSCFLFLKKIVGKFSSKKKFLILRLCVCAYNCLFLILNKKNF